MLLLIFGLTLFLLLDIIEIDILNIFIIRLCLLSIFIQSVVKLFNLQFQSGVLNLQLSFIILSRFTIHYVRFDTFFQITSLVHVRTIVIMELVDLIDVLL